MPRIIFNKGDRVWFIKEARAAFMRHGIATHDRPSLLDHELRIEAEPYIIGGEPGRASLSIYPRSATFHLGHDGRGPVPELRSVWHYNTGCGFMGNRPHKWNEYAMPCEGDRIGELRDKLDGLDQFLTVNGARAMTPDERAAFDAMRRREMADFIAATEAVKVAA